MRVGQESGGGERRPFRRRGRIVYSLIGVLVLVGLGPLVSGLWKVIRINREALVTSTQEAQLMLAASAADKLEMAIAAAEDRLALLAGMLGAGSSDTGARRHELFPSLLGSVVDARVLYLRLDDGEYSVSAGALPGEAAPVLEELVVSESRVSRPLLLDGPPRRSLLVTTQALRAGQSGGGTLAALLDLGAIWDDISGNDLSGQQVYVLDDSGYVILSTHPGLIRPGQHLRGRPLVDRFLSVHGRARETLPFVETRDGVERDMLGSYASTSSGWGVFVEARLEQIYTPVSSMVASTLGYALAVLGLALVGAILYSMSLSESINRLVELSRALAAGDYSLRVHVRSRNELGELAHAFNVMADEIEGHIERLRAAAATNEEMFQGTILAMAEAIDAKDPYTRGHSVRVNRYSVIIARYHGLSQDEIRDVHVASLLHDVGKIGIDDAILKKPGRLTPEEYAVIKTHAARGSAIMSRIPQMMTILPGLRWHHERMDGSGYPDGLVGKEIPLLARIIAVADTFDAVTSNRSYQRTRSFPEGLQLLDELRGELDPELVDTFKRAYARGEIEPRPAEAPPGETAETTTVPATV